MVHSQANKAYGALCMVFSTKPAFALLICVGILWLVQFFTPSPVAACSPAPPTPWFVEQLSVGAASLPTGVSLRSLSPTRIAVSNRSTTPLYVIGQLDIGGTEYEQLAIRFPPDTGALHRLVAGQLLTWGPGSAGPDKPPVLMWNEDRLDTEALEIAAWPNSISSGRGSVAPIERRNQTGDHQPATVAVPPSQQTQLTLVYGDQLFTVPLTVSYILNKDYDPQSVARAMNACGSNSFVFSIAGATIAAMIALIIMTNRVSRQVGKRAHIKRD
jgi:hypothetical protein